MTMCTMICFLNLDVLNALDDNDFQCLLYSVKTSETLWCLHFTDDKTIFSQDKIHMNQTMT